MKIYTNSKGESLPKVICAVVDFESNRMKNGNGKTDLSGAFIHKYSTIFGHDPNANIDKWNETDEGNYDHFYSIFPTCKNLRGQELPEEIQVEIVEERLRLGKKDEGCFATGYFNWLESTKGNDYWDKIFLKSDYTPTEIPTKSDDTFTQGETVEVSDYKEQWYKKEYVSTYKGLFITFDSKNNSVGYWKYCRKPILELTLPELLTIAEEVKGTKVKLKS